MKNFKKELQAPQVGLYNVLNAYNVIHNGKSFPVAEVIFKAPNWSNFDLEVRRIRLASLQNKSSIGPKDDFSIESLTYKYIHISDKFTKPNPNKPGSPIYGLVWDLLVPENYDEKIQQDSELEMDFMLQDEGDLINKELLTNIIEGMELDDMLVEEMTTLALPIVVEALEEA